MADPLSISASIVALLQASGAVVQYLKSTKDANKDIQALKIEVINVRGLLFSLKDLLPEPDSDEDSLLPVFESLGGQDGPLEQFEMTLGDLAAKLKPKEGLKKTGQSLSWHFKKDDIKSLIGTLERYKTLFSLALQNDQLKLSRMISENVTSLKQDAMHVKKGVFNLQKIQEDEHRQNAIRWFSSVDVSTNHYMAYKKHEPLTGDWFIRSAEFTKWKNDPGGFIWLYGFAGSGKTVLCSTVIQHTKQVVDADPTKVLVYFYFDFRDKEKQNVSDFLRSIIAQALNALPILLDDIKTLYQNNAFQKPPSEIPVLQTILRSILTGREAYIIADALDECTEREDLLLVLSEIADMKTEKLHILVTSRQERDILEALEPVVTRSIGLGGSKIDKDIAIHVHNQVVQHPKLKKWSDSVKLDIEEKLVAKAQGMFRWVFCQLNALKTCRKESTLRERLNQLPKDLDETYDRVLQNIVDEDADEAFAALQWLAYSERPLYLDELAEAIVIQPNKYSLDDRDRLLDPHEVLHICSSLVVLDNENMQETDEEDDQDTPEPKGDEEQVRKVVSFAHFSVKEYLTSDRIRKGPASRFAVSAHAAHAFIGQTCLSYLLAFDKDDSLTEDQLEIHPLLEYAGRSWPNHVRFVEKDTAYSEKTSMLALELLHSRPYAFLNWLRVSDPDWRERNYIGLPRLDYDFYDIGRPIYYASLLHLPLVAKALLESGADVNERGGGFGHALHAALSPLKSRVEYKKEVKDQIRKDQLTTKDPRTVMVQLLLDYGADIEAENGNKYPVLYVAVANDLEQVVRLLLDLGADVKATRHRGMTVLMNAALHGRQNIVRLLLDKGADIEAKDGRDGRSHVTVLCAVARFGNKEMVQLLLEKGANIAAKDDQGRTALHYATQDGRKDVVELLLDRGANIALKDDSGRTALHYAAAVGDVEVIQVLLEKGADISEKDDKGETALYLAASERKDHKQEAVRLLVEKSADIRGGYYRTQRIADKTPKSSEKKVRVSSDANTSC